MTAGELPNRELIDKLALTSAALARLTRALPPGSRVLRVGHSDATLEQGNFDWALPNANRPDLAWSGAPLPYALGELDGAVAIDALGACPEPAAALAEIARVVAPGCPIVIVELDWSALVWEHWNRPLTELIRQAAWRRVARDPFLARQVGGWLVNAGWESIAVEARVLVNTERNSALLRFAEQATIWAIQGARCTPPAANAWLADLEAAAEHGGLFAALNAYLFSAERAHI